MDKLGTILVVDDEEDILEILRFNLEKSGYAVDCALSAEEAMKILSPKHDLILLDIMLGGISGFEMAEAVRRDMASQIPIIFLTAKTGENNMLRGFSSGGDDYICKPFSVNEVLARVKAVLRRSVAAPSSDQNVIESGQIKIDLTRKMVYAADQPVTLSKKEFEILSLLARHEGKVFSRADLIEELWKDAPYVMDRTVDVHIARIRSKLGPLKNYITNRSGYGYSFKVADTL